MIHDSLIPVLLFQVYLFLVQSGSIVKYISAMAKADSAHSSPAKTNGAYSNGHSSKVKANWTKTQLLQKRR